MTVKEEKFLKYWESAQKKGKIHFIVLTGGSWAVVVPVFIGLLDLFQDSFSEVFLSKKFLIKFVVFIVIGLFVMGPIFWRSNNKRYKKLLIKQENESNGS